MASNYKFSPEHESKPLVAVQGLGFVGGAMVAALATAKDEHGQAAFRVLGIDLSNKEGIAKINAVNNGLPPIVSNDTDMDDAYKVAKREQNIVATSDINDVCDADIVVIDIPFDVKKSVQGYIPKTDQFLKSIEDVAKHVKPEALVLVETTVPPGTTENYIYPIFKNEFVRRKLSMDGFSLAHSYERVTPGKNYLHSITNFYRVYAGMDEKASERTRSFLESFINTKEYPLTKLHSPTASEMAKVMENSFRALNIAFLQEWTELAESLHVNMFDVLEAIRMRPTHKNIMSPGFGVGGYCLTKDALLADWVSQNTVGKKLGLSCQSLQINDTMPEHSVHRLEKELRTLDGKTVMLLGVSYLNDVADTRYSPSELFMDTCLKKGAKVALHDPMVKYWPEKNITIKTDLRKNPDTQNCDAVVIAVRHSYYVDMAADDWCRIFPMASVFLDSNNILSDKIADDLRKLGRVVLGVGKGHWDILDIGK